MSFGEQLFDVLMLGKAITERCNNFSSSPFIPPALASYTAPALQTGLAKPESFNHHPSQGSNTKPRVKLVITCVRKEGTEVTWLFLDHSGHIVGQLTLSPPRIMASQYDSILWNDMSQWCCDKTEIIPTTGGQIVMAIFCSPRWWRRNVNQTVNTHRSVHGVAQFLLQTLGLPVSVPPLHNSLCD